MLVFSRSLFGENNEVVLTLVSKNSTELMRVQSDIDKLYFGQSSYVQSVTGLKNLKKLTTVIFEKTAFVNDFSFLQDAENLKNLFLVGTNIKDLTFIENLPYLEKFYIIDCLQINRIPIDLKNNERLEYLEVKYCNLAEFPVMLNIHPSLKYLNLSWNNISVIPNRYKRQDNFVIFLYRNNVDYFKDKFIIFDDPADILPNEFVVNIG
jgi:Leucine-rich repeat (LRR) protein